MTEKGSDELENLLVHHVSVVFLSVLAFVELAAAVGRLLRQNSIKREEAAKLLVEVDNDWSNLYLRIPLTDDIADRAASLALEHPLKGADAVHLASSESAAVDLFVCSDRSLIQSAEGLGLSVYNPEDGLFKLSR